MTISRDKNTGRYRYDFMHLGTRYTKRGFATRKTASTAENQRRLDVAAGYTPAFKNFGDLVLACLAEKARTASPDWVRQVRWKLNKRCGRWATLRLEQVTPSHIAKLLQDIAASGNGPRSVNEYRRILHSVFNYAVNMDALMRNPVKKIARVGEPEEPIRPIPTADLQKLLLAADLPLRHQLMVQAMTGARWIETARLAPEDDLYLDQSPPYCLLRTRKMRGGGERIRKQHLPLAAVEALRAQMANYASTTHVFPGRRGQPRWAAEARCGGEATASCLRPSGHPTLWIPSDPILDRQPGGAARCQQQGKVIARFLGHVGTQATERYMHLEDPLLVDLAGNLEQQLNQ